MKIVKVNTSDLSIMFKSIKRAVSRDNTRPMYSYIRLVSKNGYLIGTALNGYLMNEYKFKEISGDDFKCLIPLVDIPKSAESVTNIIYDENKIIFDFTCYSISYVAKDAKDFNYSFEQIADISKYKHRIGMNKKILKSALDSSQNEKLIISMNDEDLIAPVVISSLYNDENHEFRSMVLPIKLKSEED